MSATTNYKILVVGEPNVGKTTYVTRITTSDFKKQYVPTEGMTISSFRIQNEQKDDFTFNLWDFGGSPLESFDMDTNFKDARGAIVLFDVTRPETYVGIKPWIRRIRKAVPNIPIVLCGNKIDLPDRSVQPASIGMHNDYGIVYYDLSAKSNYNYEKPFEYFMKFYR